MRTKTLHLKKPCGLTLVLGALLLVAMFGVLELTLRSGPLQPYLLRLTPSLGGRHLQFEEQLARLDKFARHEGHVDCIFLGSSLVWLGFNPPTFEEAILAETGTRIHCFNLGIEALPTHAAALVAEVVTEKYHPWLLLYGTSARDYAIKPDMEDGRVVSSTPWLRYQRGERTPWTWLVSNSVALRYMAHVGDLLRFDEATWTDLREDGDRSQGFLAKTGIAEDVHFAAAARDAARWFHPYELAPENLDGLSTIAKLDGAARRVIVVEMPVHSDYFAYFERGRDDYSRFLSRVTSRLATEEVVFISPPDNLVPQEGWWDKSHMNQVGADLFSRWLASHVAGLVRSGEIPPNESVIERPQTP